jgi:hypothetical protein
MARVARNIATAKTTVTALTATTATTATTITPKATPPMVMPVAAKMTTAMVATV